jgi:predicted nucleic acid-binding protein
LAGVIVLDASVLIAHFEATDAHHERATQLLVEAADESLGASPLTLAEVLVGPARTGKLDAAQAALRDLEITSIALADDAPARLATLRAGTRLRLPDCCVLLAAETAQAQLATFDDRLASAATDLGLAVRS